MYEGMQGTADKRAQDEGSCSGVVLPTDIRLPRLYTFHPSAPSVLCMRPNSTLLPYPRCSLLGYRQNRESELRPYYLQIGFLRATAKFYRV
jgi:hypothetical protein